MVAPVPAQISKPCHTHHARHALPTLFLSPLPAVAGLCFHHFPNPFFCNPFIFTSLQIPRVWGVCAHLSSLRLFALFFESSPFVFNRLQPLFAKHPGGGVFRRSHARPPYPEWVHATSPGWGISPTHSFIASFEGHFPLSFPPRQYRAPIAPLSATPVPRAYCATHLSPPPLPGRTESLFRALPVSQFARWKQQ